MQTIQNRKDAMAFQKRWDPTAPRAGDEAPDFNLPTADGQSNVRLSGFRGKRPVVLCFGSYT